RVTIVGSKKMVVYNDVSETEKIRIYDKGVDRPYETDQFNDFHLAYRNGSQTIPHLDVPEPLRVQCERFVRCIQTGERPETDGRDALQVVRILQQADRSLQNGGAREPLAALAPRQPHPLLPEVASLAAAGGTSYVHAN
ncbi:MAG TPA: hypothetical protein VFX49_19825, partial [Chloroflexota bacterium]|nr:hypothetical protein [Chloroflexota bacterium]